MSDKDRLKLATDALQAVVDRFTLNDLCHCAADELPCEAHCLAGKVHAALEGQVKPRSLKEAILAEMRSTTRSNVVEVLFAIRNEYCMRCGDYLSNRCICKIGT